MKYIIIFPVFGPSADYELQFFLHNIQFCKKKHRENTKYINICVDWKILF